MMISREGEGARARPTYKRACIVWCQRCRESDRGVIGGGTSHSTVCVHELEMHVDAAAFCDAIGPPPPPDLYHACLLTKFRHLACITNQASNNTYLQSYEHRFLPPSSCVR
ncbi:hypothetical protein GQ55_1G004900 [Panicum hallii var. hallii]|uniref:Uncharacterized protein n=1 Tax=Panicum hallii var. hallii TaxID=1504633 RepID=A0A2T7F0P5_9POAL|nr:hypothetical protein GQ55_1G004900 [Panicum hallii var. hallii]